MGNTLDRQVSQRKQVKSALERIESLEQDLARIVGAVNQDSAQKDQRTNSLAAILEATVELFGADVVDLKIKEIEERKLQANVTRAKEAISKGIESGELVKAAVITEKSLITGRELNAEGEVVHPGFVSLKMEAVKPEFREKLVGQGTPTIIETTAGGKLEVLEVFDVVVPSMPDPEETPAEAKAEA